jgi:hypothetical protein
MLRRGRLSRGPTNQELRLTAPPEGVFDLLARRPVLEPLVSHGTLTVRELTELRLSVPEAGRAPPPPAGRGGTTGMLSITSACPGASRRPALMLALRIRSFVRGSTGA